MVPTLVWFSETKTHDLNFLEKLKCDENIIYVFDKEYNDYKVLSIFIKKNRNCNSYKDITSYLNIEKLDIGDRTHNQVLENVIIETDFKR